MDIDKNSLYYMFLEIQKLHYYRTHVLLDEIGLYHGQPHMLFTLNKKDGLSQKELARRLSVTPATITVMLKRMEKSDLLIRRQDIEDQRVSRVYITDKGRIICKKAKKIFRKIEEECFGSFTEEEAIILRRLLKEMKDNLNMVNEDKDHSRRD